MPERLPGRQHGATLTSQEGSTPSRLDGRSRSGRATAELARDLLTREVGDRLPTISEYARRLGVGNGSIDKSLRLLQDHGAIQIEARGHLGSFVQARDIAGLWSASGGSPFEAAVPRPTSLEFEGLVAGLLAAFARNRIPLTPLFISGSRRRLELLLDGRVQFTVVSEFAANQAMREHPVTIAVRLSDESYYPAGSILIITRSDLDHPQAAEKVAIDLSSHDHETLTRTQFGNRPIVDVPYSLIPDRVADGSVDAAVWHRTSRSALGGAAHLRFHPVDHPTTQDALRRMARGVIVARADDRETLAVLAAVVDPAAVGVVQSEVRGGRYVPGV